MDSGIGLSLKTPSEEGFVVPLVGGQHVGAVVDTQNRHVLGVIQVLQQLVAEASGANVQEGKKERQHSRAPTMGSFITDFFCKLKWYRPLGEQSTQVLTFGVIKKYWDVFSLQAVRTTMSKTRLSLIGSIPYKKQPGVS